MKKNLFLSVLCAFVAISAQAQAFYTQDFNAAPLFGRPPGWTSKIFNVYPGRGVGNSQAMQSSFGATPNFDTLGSALLAMPSAPFIPVPIVLTFQYRIAEYIGSSPQAAPIPAGSKLEVFILQTGGAYTLVKTIAQSPNSAAYVSSGEINLGTEYYGRELKVIFKMTNTGGPNTSYLVQLDDVVFGYQLQPVAVSERKDTEGNMKITPNPVQNGLVNLRFEGAAEGTANISIADITGKIITTKNIEIVNHQLVTIETSLAAGVYFVTANTASGKLTERIIIE
jgi:Secretion system C-terminal sorting domain